MHANFYLKNSPLLRFGSLCSLLEHGGHKGNNRIASELGRARLLPAGIGGPPGLLNDATNTAVFLLEYTKATTGGRVRIPPHPRKPPALPKSSYDRWWCPAEYSRARTHTHTHTHTQRRTTCTPPTDGSLVSVVSSQLALVLTSWRLGRWERPGWPSGGEGQGGPRRRARHTHEQFHRVVR